MLPPPEKDYVDVGNANDAEIEKKITICQIFGVDRSSTAAIDVKGHQKMAKQTFVLAFFTCSFAGNAKRQNACHFSK